MYHAWDWLVAQGLYHYVLAWTVATILTWLWARRKYKKHMANQASIADALNTTTPGGLADIVKILADNADVLNNLVSRTHDKPQH